MMKIRYSKYHPASIYGEDAWLKSLRTPNPEPLKPVHNYADKDGNIVLVYFTINPKKAIRRAKQIQYMAIKLLDTGVPEPVINDVIWRPTKEALKELNVLWDREFNGGDT